MMHILHDLVYAIISTIWDVLPIAVVIFGFQLFILRKPIPNLKRILAGFLLVMAPTREWLSLENLQLLRERLDCPICMVRQWPEPKRTSR